MKKRIIIIGGGVGGLTTGALLAHDGFEVTVIEKHPIIGGGLQSFTNAGVLLDAGMHLICGMNPGGIPRMISDRLCITDKVHIAPFDKNCAEQVYLDDYGTNYYIATGDNGFLNSLGNQFPKEKENLANYLYALRNLWREMQQTESPDASPLANHPAVYPALASDFITHYISDPKLQAVISRTNMLYSNINGNASSYIHAVISLLYMEYCGRFIGGSQHYADLLAKIITDKGGQIITNNEVTKIEIQNRHITTVITKNGERITGDQYVAAMPPSVLLRLTGADAMPRSVCRRISGKQNSQSAFCIFIKFRKDTFPLINHAQYYLRSTKNQWRTAAYDSEWPHQFLFVTPPEEVHQPFATKAIAIAPITFDPVRQWEDSTHATRPADYKQWKTQMTEIIIDRLEKIYPGIRHCIEKTNSATPLTIKDYSGNQEGAIYGIANTCEYGALCHLPIATKIDNLIIASQSNILHGFCGTSSTAEIASNIIKTRLK